MFEIDFYSKSPETIVALAHEKLRTGIDDWEKQIWQFTVDWYNPAIDSVQLFTSGSTGAPKKITHGKTAMLNSAAATCKALNLMPGNSALLCLPVNKIGGMMMLVRSIYNKMKLICVRPSVNPLIELPETLHIDFAALTPMQLHGISNNTAIFNTANQIDKIILGGEHVSTELLPYILKLKNKVYLTFGMTETISHIALKRLNGLEAGGNFITLPGIEVSTDQRNCLVIKAPELGQPNLITNDVVTLISNHEFAWIGRADNVINSGGVKIYPEALEQQLANSITSNFFITSVPDNVSGEKLALALEASAVNSEEKAQLIDALSKLEKLLRPKLVLLIPQFARTENGKVKRKESLASAIETIQLVGKT